VIGAVLCAAVFGDCVAADEPLVLHIDGETFWFPNLVDYDALAGVSGHELRESMDADDWAVWAPVRHGPTGVRTEGELRLLEAPSSAHWLGTDDRGRDVLARLIHGARATVVVASGAALLALVFGTLLGVIAVWRGRAVDASVAASCDVIGAVPALLVIVAAQGLLGRSGVLVMVVLIAVPRVADTARIARGRLRAALVEPYCAAARAIGADELRVVVRHALPQARDALFVATALTAVTAVLGEAALSFLGFGVPAPTASWGELLKQAHENDLVWWLALAPGLAIAAVAASLGALSQRSEA
jgi:peptide/nickel transport system permease protein